MAEFTPGPATLGISLNAPARLVYSVTASETPEGIAREKAYYEALGRFVQMFAEVEKVVAETLWSYSGIHPTAAKIVFAGAKIEVCSTHIRQLASVVVDGMELQDLENVLQQLGIINGVRNAILHYGATDIAEGKAIVSNAWKAKAEPTEFPISPDALDRMRDDLRKIIAHLGYRHLGRPWPRGVAAISLLQKALGAPWKYKHPAPPQPQTKKAESQQARKRAPKQPDQQRASPETPELPRVEKDRK